MLKKIRFLGRVLFLMRGIHISKQTKNVNYEKVIVKLGYWIRDDFYRV
jgi:hypothetical protein